MSVRETRGITDIKDGENTPAWGRPGPHARGLEPSNSGIRKAAPQRPRHGRTNMHSMTASVIAPIYDVCVVRLVRYIVVFISIREPQAACALLCEWSSVVTATSCTNDRRATGSQIFGNVAGKFKLVPDIALLLRETSVVLSNLIDFIG